MPAAGTLPDFGDALAAARAFSLGPGAADWSIPLSWVEGILTRLAERAAAAPAQKERLEPLRQLFLHIQGALLYRAGRSEEATAALRAPMSLHPMDSEFSNWAYLALAEHALGRADKARAARPTLKDNQAWARAEVELLTAELDAALPPPGK
jgi:hypothetical protein